MTDFPSETSRERADAGSVPRPANGMSEVLELDDVFTALAHSRSRYLLYALVNGTAEATLSELATKIAAWEQEKPADDVTPDERERVHVALYHSHVPRLAALDIIEYEKEDDVIVRAGNTEQVQAVLNGAGAELDSRQETHAQETDGK